MEQQSITCGGMGMKDNGIFIQGTWGWDKYNILTATDEDGKTENIADKTGLRIEYISQYERGYCFPKKDNYNKLAKFFNWEEWE